MQNFAYLSILQVIGYVFPLITVPYLARVIGVDGYGKIAFAASIVVYFQSFVDWGFSYTAVRDIAQNKDNKQIVSRIFSNVLFSKFILLVFSAIIFYLLILTIPLLYENRVVLTYSFLLIPGYILFPDWLFQAMEEMKYITIMNFCSKLFFTILVFFVIKEKEDYVFEPLLIAMGMMVSGLFAMIYGVRKFKLRLKFTSFHELFYMIKKSSNMFISLFLPNLYTNFSVTLLGVFGGPVATGLYSSGKKFIDLSDQFSNILSRTFFPFLARRLDKHALYVKISGGVSILISVLLFCSADLLISLFYTSEFSESSTVLRIMSVSPFFLFMMNTFGPNYLVLKGREDILRNIIVFCSLFGFILAWFAIRYLNYIGVAITVTSVWGFRGILTWFYARRVSKF